MARLDVYSRRRGAGVLLNIQADLIARLNTKVVVTLLPVGAAPTPADRLNPIFEVKGAKMSMATQFMAAAVLSELTLRIATLDSDSDSDSDAIFSAIDLLHHSW